MTALLSVRGVKARYGSIIALHGIDLDVNDGEIVTLIGANGAGKSTLMMTICGNPRARAGTITFAGRDITTLATHEIARLKIAQAPEGRRIFVRMTVLENLQMGASVCDSGNFDADLARVFDLFPRLKERLNQRGGTLSGGEQQMLAIARALIRNPQIVLLDEPFEGLAPVIVHDLVAACRELAAAGQTIVLVEQNLAATLALAQRVYVINNGHVVHEGPAEDLKARPELLQRFLGV